MEETMPIDEDENDEKSIAFMTADDPAELGLVENQDDEYDDDHDDDLSKQDGDRDDDE
jgi:hypothetical protein